MGEAHEEQDEHEERLKRINLSVATDELLGILNAERESDSRRWK
jgi:hypothetical protein